MRLLTPEQAKRLDQETFQNPEFSSRDFIERAGSGVFHFLQRNQIPRAKVLVLIGPGNNGEDAKVVARKLQEEGSEVHSWLPQGHFDFPNPAKFDLVIDGLYGVGLNRPLEGKSRRVIEILNARERQPCVVAIDVPSGLNSATGNPFGVALRADFTVTMQAAKPGFFQNLGPGCTGRVAICPLPYPENLFRRIGSTDFACGIATVHRLLPRRKNFSNKGSHGTLNLVAGSARYPGAGVLAARAALRSGVGYVRMVQFEKVYPEWFEIPETLFQKWNSDFSPRPQETWVLGPGIWQLEKLEEVILRLLEAKCEKVIVDAGGLDVIAKMHRRLPSSWLLTPHPKELARLLNEDVESVQADRYAAAARAEQTFGASVLLKGYKTIIRSEERNFICLRGHSALAKAGAGDVLAGILGAFRAQGLSAAEAGVAGAFVHAMTGDLWLQTGDAASLRPTDIIELLPAAQKQIKNWRRGSRS